MMNSTVSVIIPAYNVAGYIGQALESVLAQTRAAEEIIVVDDGSTDGTAEIVGEFGNRVTLFVNDKNRGPGFSRRFAVGQSTGEYVLFLDADDWMLPGHIETVLSLFDQWPDAGVVIAGIQLADEQGTYTGPPQVCEACLGEAQDMFLFLLRYGLFGAGTQAVRRTLYDHVGGYSATWKMRKGLWLPGVDYEMMLRLAAVTRFVAAPHATIVYRRHSGQITDSDLLCTEMYRAQLSLLNRLEREDPADERVAAGRERVLRAWEESLRRAWAKRNIEHLRLYVGFGMTQSLLRTASWYYLPRCLVPAFARRSAGAQK